MLAETPVWRRKSRTAFRGGRARDVIDTVEVVATKVRRYLLALTAVSLISGVLAWLWLLVLGIDFAFVWGLVTFLLNYIPNVGSIVAVLLATLFVLVQEGWLWALIAFLGRLVTEQIIGNYLQPIIEGRILNISPLVVLVAVIFWGWVWGAAGALLAVPLTATIIIVCAHIEPLKPVALLLSHGGDEDAVAEQTAEGTR